MKYYLVLFFGILPTIIFSQNIPLKIQKSEVFQDEFKQSTVVLAENNGEDGVLLVRSYKGGTMSHIEGFYIEHYDSNLNLIKEFKFDMKHPNNEKFNLPIGVFKLGTIVHIVEIYYDLNEKSYICRANSVSENSQISKKELFRLTKEEIKKLGEISLKDNFYKRVDENWANNNNGDIQSEVDDAAMLGFSNPFSSKTQSTSFSGSQFTLVVNEAKNAFAIAIDFNTNNNEALKLYLFDDHLNTTFETLFSKEIKDNHYLLQNIQISELGDAIYVLGKDFTSAVNTESEESKYVFELTKIAKENQVSQIINPKSFYIGSLKLLFHQNQMYCLGFYSELGDSKFKGICYFKIDPNSLATTVSKYNPFTEQFIVDKYGENKDKALKFLKFKKVSFLPSGAIIFNAEEEYIYTSSSGNGSGASYRYFGDIITVKLDAEGNMLWARNINKTQATSSNTDDAYISYASFTKEGLNYFFINAAENEKTLKNNRVEFKQVRHNKSNLIAIRVDSNGDFVFDKILDDTDNKVPFMVSKAAIVNDSIYFLGRKGSDKQLLKITL